MHNSLATVVILGFQVGVEMLAFVKGEKPR